MNHKLFALLFTLVIALGYGASSPERATDVALEAPSHVLEYGHWIVKRADTAWTMRKAGQGDPCALEQAAVLHTRFFHVDAISRYGRGHEASWYTGIEPDHEAASRFLQRSLAEGGCTTGRHNVWLTDQLIRASFSAYRNAEGKLDWAAIHRANDADARYLKAVAQRIQSIWTDESGLEVNEQAAVESLEDLAAAGHYHAGVELLYTDRASVEWAHKALDLYDSGRHTVTTGRSSGMAVFRHAVDIAERTGNEALLERAHAFLDTLPGLTPDHRAAARAAYRS